MLHWMVKLPVCQPPIGWSSYICASLPLAGQATRGLASHLVDHACNLLASIPLASHACYLCASLSEAGSKWGGAPTASLLAARGLDGEGVGRGSCNGPPAHLAPARGGGQEHHLAGRSRTNTRRIYHLAGRSRTNTRRIYLIGRWEWLALWLEGRRRSSSIGKHKRKSISLLALWVKVTRTGLQKPYKGKNQDPRILTQI